ncbi:MAG: hypothetical protein H5T50_10040 [Nitrososphaeria archaeon]|nr:hypothetical protein [Nitrososphaeria archaeon]
MDKVKGEQNLMERIISYVPGYHGYREKELRREADKIIRNYLVKELNDARMMLNDFLKEIAESNETTAFSIANRTAAVLDRLINKIEHANYGYSGFFDAVKVKEDKLEKLIEYDLNVLENAKSVKETAKNLSKQNDSKVALEDFRKKLIELENLFDQRNNIIFEVSK